MASLLALVALGLLVVTYNNLPPSIDLGQAKNAPVTAPTVMEPSDAHIATSTAADGPADELLMSTTPAAVPADGFRPTATAESSLACDASVESAKALDPDGAVGQLERTRASADDGVRALSAAFSDGASRKPLNTTTLVAVVAQPKVRERRCVMRATWIASRAVWRGQAHPSTSTKCPSIMGCP